MFNFLKSKKRGQALTDYALIIGMVAICVVTVLSHLGDFHGNTFSLLNHTFEEAQRAYDEEVLNLQNAATIKEYADVAAGTASAEVAQQWSGSTTYGQDNIGKPNDKGESNPGTEIDPEGNINNKPIAKFSLYNGIKPSLGNQFKLLNISKDPDGDRIAKAEWVGVPTSNSFESAGTYTIKLRVADEHGLWSDWYQETFIIENQNPIAVITKDKDFEVLTEEDEDLAVDENKYYLIGEKGKALNLFDTSSYDPDGHQLVFSYWDTIANNTSVKNTLDFGQGLKITQNKSGPIKASLIVEDKYSGVSQPDFVNFYYFASKRPEIRNITFSDGSNNQYTTSSLESTDWITEIYPYTTNKVLQIPISNSKTRINFKVDDDSDVIQYYEYKLDGISSGKKQLNLVNKDGDVSFDVADLTTDFNNKNGMAKLNFRVCDDSDTCSRWTEDIQVEFKSVSDVKPLIKNFYIKNRSFDNSEIENNDTNNFYVGDFIGIIELDDIYGGMRTLQTLNLYLDDSALEYSNLTKINNTKYSFYFTINEEHTDVEMLIRGIYDTNDQTDDATIEGINIKKYMIEILGATLQNAENPDWYSVDLMQECSKAKEISAIKKDGTNGDYVININYKSVFNTPINSSTIWIYPSTIELDESGTKYKNVKNISVGEENIKLNSNQSISITISGDVLDNLLKEHNNANYNFSRITLNIEDSFGRESNQTGDLNKDENINNEDKFAAIKLVDFNNYTPIITKYQISDIDGYQGQDNLIYSRGEVNIDYEVEDFFLPIRNVEKPSLNISLSLNDVPNDDIVITPQESTVKTKTTFTQKITIDSHNSNIWNNRPENEIKAYTLLNKVNYFNKEISTHNLKLRNYTPNEIGVSGKSVEYEPTKEKGKYTVYVNWSKYKDYFDIEEVVLSLKYQDQNTENVVTINKEHFTVVNENELIFYSDRLQSRKNIDAKLYFKHSNNVDDSHTWNGTFFVEKPYEIEIEEVAHRQPNTTTDGFTKLFQSKSKIDSRKDKDLFENISVENSDKEIASTITMKTTDQEETYGTYKKIAITATGGIIFTNNSIGSGSAESYLINTTNGARVENVTDETYPNNLFNLFSGDIIFDNTPGSGSGIYYKYNMHYLDTIEQKKARSTTVKYINICSVDNWNETLNSCSNPFSVETTIYDNGSLIVHYSEIPESIKNTSVLAAKINEEKNEAFWTTAYGQFEKENETKKDFSNKSLRYNVLPSYYIIPPIITNVIYEQSDSKDKETIDAVTSETILAKYTVEFYNPDNANIITHDGSLTQYKYSASTNTYTETTSEKISIDGSPTISSNRYVFESKNVIRRANDKAKIQLRLKYSNDPEYYTAYFMKNDYTYVGPIIIDFKGTTTTHIEPTIDITGYTPLDFSAGKIGNCPAWSADSSSHYDDCSSDLLPLGFEMNYINGERVNSISVSTNSLIRFDNIVQTGFRAQPVTGLEDDTLAVLWYDLDFQGTSTNSNNPKGIFYKRFSDAPIPYISLKYLGLTAYSYGVEPFNYEVQIYQNGSIIIHYSKEVPVKMQKDTNGSFIYNENKYKSATTVAFKKTMLLGYGSLIVPENSSEINDSLDFVSDRKLIGDVKIHENYINMGSIGKSIKINLGQCNAANENCSSYTPPQVVENETKYLCTGTTQEVTLQPGTYKLQAWGAQGGNSGGKGGYAEETIKLDNSTKVFINVGCSGDIDNSHKSFNGGGISLQSSSGGGASDIRISDNQMAHRILVAAGGGGSGLNTSGGAGGTEIGVNATTSNGGKGGSLNNYYKANENTIAFSGYFGYGGNQISGNPDTTGGAGGGGYFGGNAGTNNAGGGGGSGYVYQNPTYTANTILIDGNSEMPTVDHSGTKIGQTRNGTILITKVEDNTSLTSFNISNFIDETKDFITTYPQYNNYNIGTFTKLDSENLNLLVLDPGTYKIQLWGAQGGNTGGKGGYVEAVFAIQNTTNTYIRLGGTGSKSTSSSSSGGYNGGGNATKNNASGGGASDIRLFQDTLQNRLAVAAGGGGSVNSSIKGGAGGGISGQGENAGTGATTESAGTTIDATTDFTPASLGVGASYTGTGAGAGGGGGYYGGGAGVQGSAGGGGSNYVHPKVKSSKLIDGTQSMPTISNSTETGHSSAGNAMIIKLTNEIYGAITEDEFDDFKIGDKRDYTETKTEVLDAGIYKIEGWGSYYNNINGDYAQSIVKFDTKTNVNITIAEKDSDTKTNVTKGSEKYIEVGHSQSNKIEEITSSVFADAIYGKIISGNYAIPAYDNSNFTKGNINKGHVSITRLSPSEIDLFKLNESRTFSTINGLEIVNLPIGTYKFELWGASGGNSTNTLATGGAGGYVQAELNITTQTKLNLIAGGKGEDSDINSASTGGYNGGGTGSSRAGAGGGATDIRQNGLNLSDRILIAGAGGGAGYYNASFYGSGGSGGGTVGLDGTTKSSSTDLVGKGGTQTSGGTISSSYLNDSLNQNGMLGVGGSAQKKSNSNFQDVITGGGAGYYGGSTGAKNASGGGGGSSFVNPRFNFTNIQIFDGTQIQPSPLNMGTQIGNSTDGYIRITKIN